MTTESTLDTDILKMKPGEVFEQDRVDVEGSVSQKGFRVGKQIYFPHDNGQVTDLRIREIGDETVDLEIVRHRLGKRCPAYGKGGVGYARQHKPLWL